MADIFSPTKRSEIMSRIRSSGTSPEERLYCLVRSALGYRWRIDRNRTDLPGRPDMVVPSLKLVLFEDGCFFHCCPLHGRIPDTRREYWQPKLRRNVERAREIRSALERDEYTGWRCWEHDLRGLRSVRLEHLLARALRRRIRQVRRS